jgi:hypothetical protein
MNASLKDRKIAFLLFGILVILGLLFAIRSWEVDRLSEQVSVLEREVARFSDSSSSKTTKTAGNNAVLPVSLSELVSEITRIGKQQSVQIVSLQPGDQRTNGNYFEQPIHLEIQAGFRDVGEYLVHLEDLQKPVQITSIRLEKSPSDSSNLLASMDLTLTVGKRL